MAAVMDDLRHNDGEATEYLGQSSDRHCLPSQIIVGKRYYYNRGLF
jgi:hypothetical protein